MASLKAIQEDVRMLTKSVQSPEIQMDKIQSDMENFNQFKTSLEFTQERLDDVEQSVNSLIKSSKFQQEKSDLMERKYNDNLHENAIWKEKWLNTETYIRRENLKFSGITKDNGETAMQTEPKLREVLKNNLELTDNGSMDFLQIYHCLGLSLMIHHNVEYFWRSV